MPRSEWRGRIAYAEMLREQLATRERVWAGDDGVVFLCEHPPVITLGRSAVAANVLDAGDVPVERIERGGDVTYHGPGQLMVYPVVRITSVVEFLARVAGAIVDACAAIGVGGLAWQRDPAGVWRECGARRAKLAACGIHVARGVSVHGFAVNVDTPAEAWRRIRPCGLDVPQLSIADVLGRPYAVADLASELEPRVVAALVR